MHHCKHISTFSKSSISNGFALDSSLQGVFSSQDIARKAGSNGFRGPGDFEAKEMGGRGWNSSRGSNKVRFDILH